MNFANKMASEVVKLKNISVPSKKNFLLEKKLLKNFKKFEIHIWKKKFIIGITNGCFDLYHEGHKYLLSQCKKYCDKLVVLLNSDNSVKINKGKKRPLDKINIRYDRIVSNINVDKCIVFSEKTPLKQIKKFFRILFLKVVTIIQKM